MSHSQAILIILDINGVLLRAASSCTNFLVRPHIEELFSFLKENDKNIKCALWSSKQESNVKSMVEAIQKQVGDLFPSMLFVWDRSSCSRPMDPNDKYGSIKDLEKVWRTFPQFHCKNTFLVDDTASKCALQPLNHMLIDGYNKHNLADNSLLELIDTIKEKVLIKSPVQSAHTRYKNAGYITFGLSLSKSITSSGEIKKKIKPPTNFQKFTLQTVPQPKIWDNALGLLTGEQNGIIVLDIDEPNDWDTFLTDNKQTKAQFNAVPMQVSARGGFHLFFKLNSELSQLKGMAGCFGPQYSIDTRVSNNFLFVWPTSYIDKDVEWSYKYKKHRSLLSVAPPPMPSWLQTRLLQGREVEKNRDSTIPQRPQQSSSTQKRPQSTFPFLSLAKNFYGVKVGRKIGIYDNWAETKEQVYKFPKAQYKGFVTKDEAIEYMSTS